jgi:hypothetical protein
MRLPSRAVALVAVAVLPLAALTACSAGSSSDGSASAKPASARAKDPNAGLPTGTQLKKALAPASAFPAGFTAVADGAADSGGTFLDPSTPSTAESDCATLETTGWMQATGYKGGVSFAQGDYANKDQTAEIAQAIDAFQGHTAETVLKSLKSVATECAAFTDTDEHAKVTVAGRATSGLGDEAYTMTLTSGHWENGTTLLAVRTGTSVITVLSTAGSDNGTATAKKVATRILGSLKDAEVSAATSA